MKKGGKFEGWKVERLGDVCELITKGTTPTTLGFSFVDSGVNFVKIESLDEDGNFLPHKMAHVTSECHDSFKRSQLRENDILFSIAGALGRVGLVNKDILPANTNQALAIIRLSNLDYTLPSFVIHCLKSQTVFDQINKLKAGVAQLNLSLEQIRELQIPIPPLPEQQRIVSVLDEAFASIAQAKSNAERNLVNARELFESVLHSVFSESSEINEETTIGDQITLQRGFDITKSQQQKGNVPVVSSGGIKSYHNVAMAKAPGVVIGRKGTLGKSYYLSDDYWPHDTTLWVKDFKGNNPRLVYYLFLHLDVTKLDSGAANPALNRNIVHPINIYWPKKAEQRAIVGRLEALSAETGRLEEIYQQKVESLEELKRSVLAKAFEGEL